jgi:hypothetical protein
MKRLTASPFDQLWLTIGKLANRHDNVILALAILGSVLIALARDRLEAFQRYALTAGMVSVPVLLIAANEMAARVRRRRRRTRG